MGANPEARARGGRLWEGWQLGLLAVALPVLALWLALPRPVAPDRVPLPEVDRRALERGLSADGERAGAARKERLSFAVRRVGELVRRFGAADANHAPRLRDELRADFAAALRANGTKPLLALRAIQTELFLAEVRRWQTTGEASRDLLELAGNFEEKCRASGWLDDRGKVVFSEPELFAFYRIRWTELTGALDVMELRPSLQEFRLYYRALLLHPEGATPGERDLRRLLYVGALGRKDPAYPMDLAAGVLLFRLGRRAAAADALTAHLEAHPEGPYALSARNYLLAALAGPASPE